MKDLVEAYNSIYQLNEIRFQTGGVSSGMLPVTGGVSPKSDPEKPKTTTATPAAVPKNTPTLSPMDQWEKENPKLAAAAAEKSRIRGTNQTDNPLIDASMRARMAAPTTGQDPELRSKLGNYAPSYSRLVNNPYAKVAPGQTTTTNEITPFAQSAIKSIEKDNKAVPFNTSKMTTTRRETFNYGGEMEQEQLQSLLAAYEEMYKTSEESEASDESLQEEDPCWKGYTQVGMKKKGGREVPNCVPSKGVPDAKGYKKEDTEIEEGAVANLARLGLAAGTAAFGMNVAKKAKETAGKIEKTQRAKEKMVNDILRNSYESEGESIQENPLQDIATTAAYIVGGGAKGAEEKRAKDLATAKRIQDIKAGRTPLGGMQSADLNVLRTTLKQSYEPEGEVVEAYDLVLNHLMSEGYASDVASAEKIMMVMSDNWMQNILNQN
jgi:hypothetical protein